MWEFTQLAALAEPHSPLLGVTGRVVYPKGRAPRAPVVEGARRVLRGSGSVRDLDDILARTATRKSQLFHYFPRLQ